jgi:hypothetical protein
MRRKLANILFDVGLTNFVVFWFVAVAIGGDAWNGKISGSHHYVCLNGRYTEVSRRLGWFSCYHTTSVVITFPLGIIALSMAGQRRGDPTHCVEGDYNLTGNVSGVCPECGRAIAAKVGA